MIARRGLRGGFSLVEMMVAMTITMAVFAITLPFIRVQTRALGSTAGRMDADQVARFAMRTIEQDLRRAAGEYGQPTVVAAGPLVLSFNANIRQSTASDVGALYDEVVGAEAGSSWSLAAAATIPLTSVTYPTTDYVNADGATSQTETITYYLVADASADVADTYSLYRQTNAVAPVELVDGLYLPSGQAFFSYYRVADTDLLEQMTVSTPLVWTDAALAELRTIGLHAAGVYYNKIDQTTTVRSIESRITLPISLATASSSCTGTPAAVTTNTNPPTATSSGPRGVSFGWTRSTSDDGLLTGVLRYDVERKIGTTGAWTMIAQVSATSSASYSWTDYLVNLSGDLSYRVTSIGCGGVSAASVVIGSLTL